MKPQDIGFIIAIIVLLITCRKRPNVFIISGLICFALSIPLFATWVFFTAERLVYFAAGFIAIGILLKIVFDRQKD